MGGGTALLPVLLLLPAALCAPLEALRDEVAELERRLVEKELELVQALREQVASAEQAISECSAQDSEPARPSNFTASQHFSDSVWVVDGFLSPEECDAVLQTVKPAGDTKKLSEPTISLADHKNVGIKALRERFKEHYMVTEEYLALSKIHSYSDGQMYRFHVDSDSKEGRFASLFVFLKVPAEGGDVVFPSMAKDVGLKGMVWQDGHLVLPPPKRVREYCEADAAKVPRIPPRVGRAVFVFHHHRDLQINRDGVYGVCPVAGEMTVAVTSMRFYKGGSNIFYDTFIQPVEQAGKRAPDGYHGPAPKSKKKKKKKKQKQQEPGAEEGQEEEGEPKTELGSEKKTKKKKKKKGKR